MSVRIAINGYGRIGRGVFKALCEKSAYADLEIVAINDLSGMEVTAHLTQYDSTHGRFPFPVTIDNNYLVTGNRRVLITAERNPEQLPWGELDIDVVMECTGRFTAREEAMAHIKAGAKKVLISAPGKNADATIVYGVNHHLLQDSDIIVSNASCTTNCLAPVIKPLHDALTIKSGLLNTVHSYTRDQMLLDGAHTDLHRARAAAHSIIPTKTGAAAAVGLVIPELNGKLDGFAMRVPVMNVSAIDFTFTAERTATVAEINQIMKNAQSEILQMNDKPLVSCDFNHCSASATFDLTQTRVQGELMKVVAWYDNEWGFSNRMLDVALYMMNR